MLCQSVRTCDARDYKALWVVLLRWNDWCRHSRLAEDLGKDSQKPSLYLVVPPLKHIPYHYLVLSSTVSGIGSRGSEIDRL